MKYPDIAGAWRIVHVGVLPFLLLLLFFTNARVWAQISITDAGFSYPQNFNTLADTGTRITWTDDSTIPGWYASEDEYHATAGEIDDEDKGLFSFGTGSSN